MASPGIKKRLVLLLIAYCLTLVLLARGDALQEGDLLFCCSEEPNAITAVTSGVEQLPIDHVAIFHRIGGEHGLPYVIEAVKPCVRLTPFMTFASSNPMVIIGRVNTDVDIRASIRRCLNMVGKPYDDLYLPGDSAVYCSELVQMNYVTSRGELVFNAIPMSFHDDSGQVTDYWNAFYKQRGMKVPEGEPGTNPGELSRRHQVTIIGRINYSDDDILFHWYR